MAARERVSLAGSPKDMIENPDDRETGDVLSNVLRTIRVSGSLQFCFMPTGAWQTDPKSSMKRPCRQRAGHDAVSYPGRGILLAENGGPADRSRGGRRRRVPVRHAARSRRRRERPICPPDRRPSAKAVAGNPDAAIRRRLAARAAALRLPAMRRNELPSSARCLAQPPARANRRREGRRMALRDAQANRPGGGEAADRRNSRCSNG